MTAADRSCYYSGMVREILTLGSEELARTAVPVGSFDSALAELIKDMFETLDANPGIGLAAPQIGVNLRLFVIKLDDGIPRVFINPEITATSAERSMYEEGCLSIPGLWADVSRPKAVSVFAYDAKGRPFNLDAEGLLARCIQHEYDHLDGKLFIDRLSPHKREGAVRQYEKISRQSRRKKH